MSNLCFWCFAASTTIQVLKNRAADNKIRRQGNKISLDKRSFTEIASSFIKDYFYLLVPFYNVYRGVKLFLTNDNEYANKRLAKLNDYERISKNDSKDTKQTKTVPIINKNELKNKVNEIESKAKKEIESVKKSIPSFPQKNEEIISNVDDIFDIIEKSTDMVFINNIKTTYRQKSLSLRSKYDELSKFPNTEMERKKIVRRVKLYDAIFVTARDRLVYLNNNKVQINRH